MAGLCTSEDPQAEEIKFLILVKFCNMVMSIHSAELQNRMSEMKNGMKKGTGRKVK